MCLKEEDIKEFIDRIRDKEKKLKEFEHLGEYLLIKTDIQLMEPLDGYNDGRLIFMSDNNVFSSDSELTYYLTNFCKNYNEILYQGTDIWTTVAYACIASFEIQPRIINAPQFNISNQCMIVSDINNNFIALAIYVPVYNNYVITTRKEI